jgi:hypothetical protein
MSVVLPSAEKYFGGIGESEAGTARRGLLVLMGDPR